MKQFTKTVIQTHYMCQHCGKTSTSKSNMTKHEQNCSSALDNLITHDGKYTEPTNYYDAFEFVRHVNDRGYGKPQWGLRLSVNKQFSINNKDYKFSTNNNYSPECDAHRRLIEHENLYFTYSTDEDYADNKVYVKPESLKDCKLVVTYKDGKQLVYDKGNTNRDYTDYPITLYKSNRIVKVEIIDKPKMIEKTQKTIKLKLDKPKHSVYSPSKKQLITPAGSNYRVNREIAKYWLDNTDYDKDKLRSKYETIALSERTASHNLDDFLRTDGTNSVRHFQGSRPECTILGLETTSGSTKKAAILNHAFNRMSKTEFPDNIMHIGDKQIRLENRYCDVTEDYTVFYLDDTKLNFDDVYDLLIENNSEFQVNVYKTKTIK